MARTASCVAFLGTAVSGRRSVSSSKKVAARSEGVVLCLVSLGREAGLPSSRGSSDQDLVLLSISRSAAGNIRQS